MFGPNFNTNQLNIQVMISTADMEGMDVDQIDAIFSGTYMLVEASKRGGEGPPTVTLNHDDMEIIPVDDEYE